jgi:hypothetical protein
MNTMGKIGLRPTANDVVITMKGNWTSHSGNEAFRTKLETYRRRMQQAKIPTKFEVEEMANEVRMTIETKRGRFLRQDPADQDGYDELSGTECAKLIKARLLNLRGRVGNISNDRILYENGMQAKTAAPTANSATLRRETGEAVMGGSALHKTRATRIAGVCCDGILIIEIEHHGAIKQEELVRTRRWLDENQLPQTVVNRLVAYGARMIRDVALLVERRPDILSGMLPLDAFKLRRAVENIKNRTRGQEANNINDDADSDNEIDAVANNMSDKSASAGDNIGAVADAYVGGNEDDNESSASTDFFLK